LPKDPELRDRIIRRVFGAPDFREIDCLGGADPLTSKMAIIGPSTRTDCDVDYLFGQVSMSEPMIDWKSNCGNLSSAVGPYAIDEGLVDSVAPVTKVRVHQVNTRKVIVVEVPVRGNKAEVEGDHSIDGVPGTGAKLILDWADSAGSLTGKLLPTGNVVDVLPVEGVGDIEVSMVDAAMPVAFIDAAALDMKGSETPYQIDSNKELLEKIERIRSCAAVKMGLCEDWRMATQQVPYSPFIAICAAPLTYRNWTTEGTISEESVDLVVKLLFMQQMHKAYPVTGTICTFVAAMIPGTMANRLARPGGIERGYLRIGHPAGIIVPDGKVAFESGTWAVKRATVDRTARCLMRGYAFVPRNVWGGNK
jgi:2-methylaconitate cis-trans-isomerase PrpF